MTILVTDHTFDPGTAERLRQVAHDAPSRIRRNLYALADALDDARGKRRIVLDPDELGLTAVYTPQVMRDIAAAVARSSPMAAILALAVADQLDALVPDRPDEPTGLGAVVRGDDGIEYIRIQHDYSSQHDYSRPWVRRGPRSRLFRWMDIPGPVVVLSPGMGGGAER